MASTQTTSYGLNQWHPEDPVLRQEFNLDNTKVDIAIDTIEKNIMLIRLAEFVVSQDCAQFDLVLTEQNLSQFSQVRLTFYAQTSGYSIYLRLNGQQQNVYQTLTTNNYTSATNPYLIRTPAGTCITAEGFLAPFADGTDTCGLMHGLCQSAAEFIHWPSAGRGPIPYASLHTLNFYSDGTIKAGSRFTLYGVVL